MGWHPVIAIFGSLLIADLQWQCATLPMVPSSMRPFLAQFLTMHARNNFSWTSMNRTWTLRFVSICILGQLWVLQTWQPFKLQFCNEIAWPQLMWELLPPPLIPAFIWTLWIFHIQTPGSGSFPSEAWGWSELQEWCMGSVIPVVDRQAIEGVADRLTNAHSTGFKWEIWWQCVWSGLNSINSGLCAIPMRGWVHVSHRWYFYWAIECCSKMTSLEDQHQQHGEGGGRSAELAWTWQRLKDRQW